MSKKILSLLLIVTLLFSTIPFGVFATEQTMPTATVYLTISQYGKAVQTKDDVTLAYLPVELTGKEKYTIDDVLKQAHLEHSPNSEEDYVSSDGGWGLSIDKLWGDTSGYFGYQVNGGTEGVMNLSHEVEDGDYVDAYIYENKSDLEAYTKFTQTQINAETEQAFELTLMNALGWDMVFTPCSGAAITIDGKETEFVTDENGVVSITLDTAGRHIISAQKTKTDGKITTTAITAPVCVVNTKLRPEVALIHAIAEEYLKADLTAMGSLLPWVVADMMVYETLYPESQHHLTETQKQAYLDLLIAVVSENEDVNVLARTIIMLRAMGYDPKSVYTSSLEKIDLIAKLTELANAEDSNVANIYNLPYVLIALRGEMSGKTKGILLNLALSQRDSWQDATYGTDALSPMLLALAPYCSENANVSSTVEQAVKKLKTTQREDGLLWSYFEGGESATTALAIAGLSALGTDVETVKKTEKNLIDGLMSDVNDTASGFSNAFATEQGFRALLAWRLLLDADGKIMYDFEVSEKPAYATWASACPVIFDVIPADATVSVEGVDAVSGNSFDLAEGTYLYTVSKSGYETKNGEITVTAEEAEAHITKKISLSLVEELESGGGTSSEINVTVCVMIHDASDCHNQYTYKNNASDYKSLVTETVTVSRGTTVFAAFDKALSVNGISYEEGSPGYIASIDGLGEFDHGEKSGWMFTVNGQHQTTGSRETVLNTSATVIWFYTDDYTNETGSSGFSSGGSVLSKDEPEIEEVIPVEPVFSDVQANDWFYDAVCYVYENGLFEGTEIGFEPNASMTRAMLVTVLHRMEGCPAVSSTYEEDSFEDVTDMESWYYDAVTWAVAEGIVNGYDENTFSPNDYITREQIATIIYRYAQKKGLDVSVGEETNILFYDDAFEISKYAIAAVQYTCGSGIINGMSISTINPKGVATRAQVATILMRFCKMITK